VSGLAQLHSSGSAAEELSAELSLKGSYGCGQCRLSNMAARCGTREMSFLSDGDKLLQLLQIH